MKKKEGSLLRGTHSPPPPMEIVREALQWCQQRCEAWSEFRTTLSQRADAQTADALRAYEAAYGLDPDGYARLVAQTWPGADVDLPDDDPTLRNTYLARKTLAMQVDNLRRGQRLFQACHWLCQVVQMLKAVEGSDDLSPRLLDTLCRHLHHGDGGVRVPFERRDNHWYFVLAFGTAALPRLLASDPSPPRDRIVVTLLHYARLASSGAPVAALWAWSDASVVGLWRFALETQQPWVTHRFLREAASVLALRYPVQAQAVQEMYPAP